MTDHINITHPDSRDRWMHYRREIERLKADLTLTNSMLMEVQGDLSSIFTRIQRGEQVELHYPDGTVIPITKARRRGGSDTGDGVE